MYDVAIVGGGPAGLAAALTLGRARRKVLLIDSGARRNQAATHVHNFVTRDGTPPSEFREVGREQLNKYPNVEIRDVFVTSTSGERDAFLVETSTGIVKARRLILCTGMVDEVLTLPGFKEAWGHSIFQCPYCHGWEVRGQQWGYLALDLQALEHGFPAVLQSWTNDVLVFTCIELNVPQSLLDDLKQRGIQYEPRVVQRLVVEDQKLTHVELLDGEQVPCEVLFAHTPQHQVDLVKSLELELDAQGYVKVDPMSRQTSTPGIYAAGDLTTRAQAAIFAASTGMQTAGMVNYDLALARKPGE